MQHIRKLSAHHVRSLAECHIACWREAYRGVVPDHLLDAFDLDRREQQWERVRRAGDGKIFVAVDGGDVIGFCSSGPSKDSDAPVEQELYALYLRSRFHGSGLADALLDAAIGPEPASLWVFEPNPRAQAFYRKAGFDADGARKLEPFSGVTEIRMIRSRDRSG